MNLNPIPLNILIFWEETMTQMNLLKGNSVKMFIFGTIHTGNLVLLTIAKLDIDKIIFWFRTFWIVFVAALACWASQEDLLWHHCYSNSLFLCIWQIFINLNNEESNLTVCRESLVAWYLLIQSQFRCWRCWYQLSPGHSLVTNNDIWVGNRHHHH